MRYVCFPLPETLLRSQLRLLPGQLLIASSDISELLPILLPSAALVAGVHAFKPEYTPVALAVAGVITAYALVIVTGRTSSSAISLIV